MLVFAGTSFILLCVVGFIIGTKGDQCITPNDEDGQCVYIEACKSLMDIVEKPLVTDFDKYTINAHTKACQHTKKQNNVCCPISEIMPPETTTTKVYVPPIQESCAVGRCVNIHNCSVLLNIALNNYITAEDKKYLQGRRCKSNTDVLSVCCPEPEQPEVPKITNTTRQTCVTPKGVPGICMVLKDCIPISLMYRKHKQEGILFLDDSQCQDGLYCCPTVVYPATEAPTTRTKVNTKRCETTKGKPGICVPIRRCRYLRDLSVKSHRASNETKLLEQSKCGPSKLTYKVCCSEDDYEMAILPSTEECGKSFPMTYRVSGGHRTGIDEYPWTALLLYEHNKGSSSAATGCGGSLINKYYVITAAHCKKLNGSSLVKVRLGDWNIITGRDCDGPRCEPHNRTMEIRIRNIIIHPSYNALNYDYDVALLRLKVRVDYTKFIKPICLPLDVSLSGKRYVGNNTTIVGWGSTEMYNYSAILLQANVQIIKANEHYIIATGKGKDSCLGDSGGPLMIEEEVNGKINWYLIGIISYGNLNNTCGTEKSTGTYQRVGYFVDWIKDTIKT